MCLSRSEDGRGLIGVQDTVETAIFGLRNYVRNSKERLVIAAHTIKDEKTMKIEKHQMSTKRGKRMKGKHSGCKNNSMENLSGKQRVKKVKIEGDG